MACHKYPSDWNFVLQEDKFALIEDRSPVDYYESIISPMEYGWIKKTEEVCLKKNLNGHFSEKAPKIEPKINGKLVEPDQKAEWYRIPETQEDPSQASVLPFVDLKTHEPIGEIS